MRCLGVAIVALPLLLIVAGSATAAEQKQESRMLSDKYILRLGGQLDTFSTDISASRGSLGAAIRLEDTLGYDEDESSLSLSGRFRLGQGYRKTIQFAYAQFDRDTSGILDGEVPIFDVTFIGAFESEFNIKLLQIAYQYSFINNGEVEAGVGGGLSTYNFDLVLNGVAEVDDGTTVIVERSDNSTDLIAPLPSVGFFVMYAITPRVIVEFSTNLVDLEISDYEGRMLNSRFGFNWIFTDHVGLGLATSSTDIHYEKKSDDDLLTVDFRQSAYSLFLVGVF